MCLFLFLSSLPDTVWHPSAFLLPSPSPPSCLSTVFLDIATCVLHALPPLVPRSSSHLFQAHLDSTHCHAHHWGQNTQTRRADLTGLWPGFSVKWQNNLVPSLHFIDDETEAQRWKVVRVAQPAGLEYSSFNSQASRPHPHAWPDVWLPRRHTCKCHGTACQALGTGFEPWFHSSVIFYLS